MDGEQVRRMDVKKDRSTSATKMEGRKVISFVGDVKQELKKVEWTNQDELKSYTKIVLASIVIFGLFIYLVDLGVQGGLNIINLFVKLITG